MECEHFLLLQRMVKSNPGGNTISYYLGKVFEESPPNVQKAGIALTLRENNLRPNQEVMQLIFDNLPHDDFEMQRYLILRCIPLPITLHPNLCKIVADHVTDILTEPRPQRLQLARDNLGEFLMQIPELVLRHNEIPLLTTFSYKDRVAVLYYIEHFVKPVFDSECLRMSNRMYSVLAKNLPNQTFNQFFKCVLESDNYSYHNLMAAFTHRAKTNRMPIENTLKFMKTKKNEMTTRETFGIITLQVIERIEYNFLHELLKTTTREEMDFLLNAIRNDLLVTPEALEKVLFKQYHKLERQFTEEMSLSERLHNLSSRCVLIRPGKIMRKRHKTLSQALELEREYSDMTDEDKKVFFAVLASQSFPKIKCREVGSDALFKILGSRLLDLVPATGASFCMMELNEYANVVYAMYNLYRINHRYKRLLRDILPEWRSRLVTLIDLQMMSSANLHHAIPNENNEQKKIMLKRINYIIIVAGTILAYLFGNVDEDRVFVIPHYYSLGCMFHDFLFTDSFNTTFLAPLGLYQTCPGPPVRLLGNNEFERLERLGAINDAEEDSSDEEDDNEDDDSASEDDDDSQDEDSSSDDDSFSEGELNSMVNEGDDSGGERVDEADDENTANEQEHEDPASAGNPPGVIGRPRDLGIVGDRTNWILLGPTQGLDEFLDSLFVDPNLDVQTPNLSVELLANSLTSDGALVERPLEADNAPTSSCAPVEVDDLLSREATVEIPEHHSQQWWRNNYGMPNGFTAEEMAMNADRPIELDRNLPVEGSADPNEWGNLNNAEERRFSLWQ